MGDAKTTKTRGEIAREIAALDHEHEERVRTYRARRQALEAQRCAPMPMSMPTVTTASPEMLRLSSRLGALEHSAEMRRQAQATLRIDLLHRRQERDQRVDPSDTELLKQLQPEIEGIEARLEALDRGAEADRKEIGEVQRALRVAEAAHETEMAHVTGS